MESLDSVSPCSTPSHSGSATPTSGGGSYSGVLGSGKMLAKKLQYIKENELQDVTAADGIHTNISSERDRAQNKTRRTGNVGAVKTSGEDEEVHGPHQTDTSFESETKQPRIGYMTKRHKERTLRGSGDSCKTNTIGVPVSSSEPSSLELNPSPSLRRSTKKEMDKEIDQEQLVSKQPRKRSDSQGNNANHPIKISKNRSLSSSLPRNHISLFSSVEASLADLSVPKWKRELIQKKKLSGSPSKGPLSSQENVCVPPEWIKKAHKRNQVSVHKVISCNTVTCFLPVLIPRFN